MLVPVISLISEDPIKVSLNPVTSTKIQDFLCNGSAML